MCKRCDDFTADHGPQMPGRRKVLFAGAAGLAAAPIAAGLAGRAEAQETVVDLGVQSVLAHGATRQGGAIERILIERRAVGPKDVRIDILYSSICHSDIHALEPGGRASGFPRVPGHEIVGRVEAVGSAVTKFRVGDFAGVGCMVDSCRTCANCLADREQNCLNGVTFTYNSEDKVSGGHTFGGYSDKIVVAEHFGIRIQPGADLARTAPLLCAGVTTFSPLQHWKVERGQKVAVIGLGGLGHMAVKLAVARGAEVTVFTTTPGKIEDARRLGAQEAVLWTDTAAFERLARRFDLMIATVPQAFPMQTFLPLLALDATLVTVGVLGGSLQGVDASAMLFGRISVAGSVIGGIAETQEVVDYCFARDIKADIELIRPDQINEAYARVIGKDVRYRFVIDYASAKAA